MSVNLAARERGEGQRLDELGRGAGQDDVHREALLHQRARQLRRFISGNATADAERDGYDLVLDIDVQGARQLKEKIPAAVSIFVLAPSRQVLEERLRARSQDSGPVIQRRLKDAAEEIRNYSRYDYVLVNREVAASVDTLVSIVKAVRSRRERMESEIRPILETFRNG